MRKSKSEKQEKKKKEKKGYGEQTGRASGAGQRDAARKWSLTHTKMLFRGAVRLL